MSATRFQSNHSADIEPVEQIRGGFRRTLGDGKQMMLIEWTFEPGTLVPQHQHPHEQSGYVVSGEMFFTVEGAERKVPAGMGYLIPSNVPHGARFEQRTVLIDIFSPPREDYRGATVNSSYLLGNFKSKTKKQKRKSKK